MADGSSRAPGRGSSPSRLRAIPGDALRGLALALAALTLACGEGAEQAEGEGSSGTPVDVVEARRDTLSVQVRAVGSLEAEAQIEVQPQIAGRVTSIHFQEGERVAEGEPLVRLDEHKLRARVEAARATVNRARAEVENLERSVDRNDSLLVQGAISEQAFDDLQTRYSSARARLEEARANLSLAEQRLEDATLRAPFAGRTGARSFDLGDYVRIGEPLFTLVDDDPLEIAFSVPERHLGRLDVGRQVQVTVQSRPDRPVRGIVHYVSPYVDASNRTVDLKARIPNSEAELRAGQFADVLLELESRPAVVVPEAAVLARQEGSSVFAVEDGRAALRQVETGIRREGMVELLSGVEAGDSVVVAGHQRLTDGSPVSPTEEPAGTSASGDSGDSGAPPADGS